MLIVTSLIILLQFLVAVVSPIRFIYLALWIQTIPYTWNWDTQLIYETPLGPLNVVAIQLFGFILCCLWVVGSQSEGLLAQLFRYKWHAAFLVFCAVSLSYAPSFSYGLRMMAKLIGPFLFMIAALVTVKTREHVRAMEKAIIGSGLILIMLAIVARSMGVVSDYNVVSHGIAGLGPPSMGPPVFSAHMLPVCMLAFATYICNKQFKMLLFTIVCALCILAALQRTSAAAMYLGISAILFVGTRGVTRFVLPVTGVIGLPLLMIFNSTFRQRMFFGVNDSQQILNDPAGALQRINGSGRFALWDTALTRFFNPSPIQGSGVGATQEYLYRLARGGASVVHSEYVRLLCEVGIVGITLFGLAATTYIAYMIKTAIHPRSSESKKYSLAAFGAIITYLLFFTTDNGLDYVTQFGAYVFALMAMAYKANELQVLPETSVHQVSAAKSSVQLSNLMS